MKAVISILFVSLAWLKLGPAYAVTLSHLYTTKIFVTDKSVATRQAAARQGLEKILIKVSGNTRIASHPVVQKNLQQAEAYLQGFSFQAIPSDGYWQICQFNAQAVKKLLANTNQPVWGEQRPQLLTWMVVEQADGPQLIYANSGASIPRLLSQFANFRGLPIILPMQNAEALDTVTVEDIQQLSINKLLASARRYTAPAILVIRLFPEVLGPWQGEWLLWIDGEQVRWQNQGDSLANTLQDGVNNAADLLVKRYAVLTTAKIENEIELRVTEVRRLSDYVRVKKYLDSLSTIRAVSQGKVQGTTLRFHLSLNSDRAALEDSMKLHPILLPTKTELNKNPGLLEMRLKHAA